MAQNSPSEPQAEPMIKLEPGGKAPILSYNVPEPTSYSGQNFVELDFQEPYFKPELWREVPSGNFFITNFQNKEPATIQDTIIAHMRSGFSNAEAFPLAQVSNGFLRFEDKPGGGLVPVSNLPLSRSLFLLDPKEVAAKASQGLYLKIYQNLFGTLSFNFVEFPSTPRPRLYLVETYRLSSFLGAYGAGRVLKTFSLLPGEKTKISVKSYSRKEETAKAASSILDSVTEESAVSFETDLEVEQSDRKSFRKMSSYHAEAEANAKWGWGSAKASGGIKGETNSAREEFARNVSKAAQKHAAKASAKRDVQVNTSSEVKQESGDETVIEREVQNVNLSRTLNFVFRQMNQEFITLLHLVDVRVAFFTGFSETKREVPLAKLDDLLAEVVVDGKQKEVRDAILAQLATVLDYRDQVHSLTERRSVGTVTFPGDPSIGRTVIGGGDPGTGGITPTTGSGTGGSAEGDGFVRVRKDLVSTYKDEVTGTEIRVPGIILSAQKMVLRTEGIIVEALLGQGGALDGYATRLQEIEVARRESEAAGVTAASARSALINELVRNNDLGRAKILASLLPQVEPPEDKGSKP